MLNIFVLTNSPTLRVIFVKRILFQQKFEAFSHPARKIDQKSVVFQGSTRGGAWQLTKSKFTLSHAFGARKANVGHWASTLST